MESQCQKCGAEKRKDRPCKPCRAAYMRELNDRKKGTHRVCQSCGESKRRGTDIKRNAKRCIACKEADPDRAQYRAQWYADNREHRLTYARDPDVRERNNAARRARPKDHPSRVSEREKQAAYREENRELVRKRSREESRRRAKNPYWAAYRREHWQRRHRMQKRMEAILSRLPGALEDLRAFYQEALATGLTVDHIVPINHPDVCGLHVPWNLQFLTHEENMQKNNSLPPDDQLVAPGPYRPTETL